MPIRRNDIWNLSSDGSESGQYLALDLGGTNFRVIKLQLDNGRITDETIDYFSVEEHLRFVIKTFLYVWHDPLHFRLGPGANLFLFLAECIKTFLEKHNISSEESLPLGFTFSFPMTQTALDCGLLVNWTKVTIIANYSISHLAHCRVSTVLEWWVRMWWLCWSMLSPK